MGILKSIPEHAIKNIYKMFMPFCIHHCGCMCTRIAQLLHPLREFPWIHTLHRRFSTGATVFKLETSTPEEYAEQDAGSRSYLSLHGDYATLHHVIFSFLLSIPADPACWISIQHLLFFFSLPGTSPFCV